MLKSKIFSVRGSGRLLWPYDKAKDFSLSQYQILDQMYRHYHRHATNSDKEGKLYETRLISEIKEKSEKLKQLRIKIQEDEKLMKEDEEVDEETNYIIKSIEDLTSALQKRNKTQTKQQKLELINNLVERDIDIEYLQLELDHEVDTNIPTIEILTDDEQSIYSSDIDRDEEGDLETVSKVRKSTRMGKQTVPTYKTTLRRNQQITKELESKDQELNDIMNQLALKKHELENYDAKHNLLQKQYEDMQIEFSLLEARIIERQTEVQQQQDLYNKLQDDIATMESHMTKNQLSKEDISTQTEVDIEEYSISQESDENEEIEEASMTETQKLSHGQKQLEQEFIRHGRKVWNDKDVKDFLRRYKKVHHPINLTNTCQKQSLNTDKLITEISAIIKTIYNGIQEIREASSDYNNKINTELEKIRSSKPKQATIQLIHENYTMEMHEKYKKLQTYCEEQIEKLQSSHYEIYEDKFENMQKVLLERLENCFTQQTKCLQEQMGKNQNTTSKTTKSKDPKTKSTKPLTKKLILIPQDNNLEIKQIEKIIREEPKEFAELKTIRKTKNKNIELKTSENEVNELKELLSKKLDNIAVINPEERLMKLLLLRIDKDISEEDLKQEIEKRQYLESFKIKKVIDVQGTQFNNWIIEAPASQCRKAVKTGKMRLFYETKRVEFHIGVTRCTNCQDLNSHTKSQCEFRMRCAKCSDKHLTIDCKETKVKCINCIRRNRRDINHPAYSSSCPVYQFEKQTRLQDYYHAKDKVPGPYITEEGNRNINRRGNQPDRQRDYDNDYEDTSRIPPERSDRRTTRTERIERYDSKTDNRRYNAGREHRQYEDNYINSNEGRSQNIEDKAHNNQGETRVIRMRTFANSNRKTQSYQYPKYKWEALPPRHR